MDIIRISLGRMRVSSERTWDFLAGEQHDARTRRHFRNRRHRFRNGARAFGSPAKRAYSPSLRRWFWKKDCSAQSRENCQNCHFFELQCCSSSGICSASKCVAVCCSVLQCVTVSCSVLQPVAACCSVVQVLQCYFSSQICRASKYDAGCCSVLQCVAVCCSVYIYIYVHEFLYQAQMEGICCPGLMI